MAENPEIPSGRNKQTTKSEGPAFLYPTFRHPEIALCGGVRARMCLPAAIRSRWAFHAFLPTLFREDWVVYAKRPFVRFREACVNNSDPISAGNRSGQNGAGRPNCLSGAAR